MPLADRTPADLVITPRNLEFGRGQTQARWWHGGDPVPTTLYNALSSTFPLGEAFFIDSVRKFRNEVPEKLRREIAEFTKQEGVHSREHVEFNRHIVEAGYDLSAMEARLKERIKEQREMGPLIALAVTMCLEHLTAILAHTWLKGGDYFKDAPREIERLWTWHAIEEIEHKAVAFDTFMYATKDWSPLKRWFFRCMVMQRVTRRFMVQRVLDMKILFGQDGLDKPSTWFRLVGHLFGRPGLLRKTLPAWLAFFRLGFHPWDIDDRALIGRAESRLELQPA